MPKGLYAMIFKVKPGNQDELEVAAETADLEASAVAKYGNAILEPGRTTTIENGSEKTKLDVEEKMKQLRIASGETSNDEIPVTRAPLIFPLLDVAAPTPYAEA